MKTIEYRVTFTGKHTGNVSEEVVQVKARDINSGFPKALKHARTPLGNGYTREIASIEFWQVI